MTTYDRFSQRFWFQRVFFTFFAAGIIAACSSGSNSGSVGDPVEDSGAQAPDATGPDAKVGKPEAGPPGAASVTAKFVVSGSTGTPGAAAQPFKITEAIIGEIQPKLSTLACGQVYVETGGLPATKADPVVPGLRVYAKVCSGGITAMTQFDLPFVEGDYPATNPGFPAFFATVGPAGTSGRTYRSLNETTLVVDAAEGIDVDIPDWNVKRLAVRIEGDAFKDPSACGEGSNCASGGPTVHVAIDLEFRDLLLALAP